MSVYTTVLILPDYIGDDEAWLEFDRSKWSLFLNAHSHYKTINIIVCGNDWGKIYPWTQSSVAHKFPSLIQKTWKNFIKIHEQIYAWLEMFEENFESPTVNFITSQQAPIINQKLLPRLLPKVSQIYYFKNRVRYYQEDNPCWFKEEHDYISLLK